MKKSMKFATYRFLFQKNEAHHNNVYITSNGPVFKQAGNLLEHAKSKTKSDSFQNGGAGKSINRKALVLPNICTMSPISTFFLSQEKHTAHPLANP